MSLTLRIGAYIYSAYRANEKWARVGSNAPALPSLLSPMVFSPRASINSNESETLFPILLSIILPISVAFRTGEEFSFF